MARKNYQDMMNELTSLYDGILDIKEVSNSSAWLEGIFEKITSWETEVLA